VTRAAGFFHRIRAARFLKLITSGFTKHEQQNLRTRGAEIEKYRAKEFTNKSSRS
jgi:hypothetical protein